MNTTEKQLLGRLLIAMAAYAGLVAVAAVAGPAVSPGPAAWGLAVLPVLPALYALARLVAHIAAMDELQRLIHLQAAAVATGLTVVAGLTAGSLRAFGGLPPVDLVWAVPFAAVGWMAGLAFAKRRYA